MRHYEGVKLVFIAPDTFEIEPDIKAFLDEHDIPFTETGRLHEILPTLDAIYVTRVQSEHDVDNESSRVDLAPFTIGKHELGLIKKTAVIMHPLPRGPELAVEVDQDPRAMYWRQERNGMWMRAALIAKIFDVDQQIRELASQTS
jgi:aspartate carbamoyltransferase catalytic subunit